MAKTAIIFGGLLILEGLGFYFGIQPEEGKATSITALIPSFFGIPILLGGLLALKEQLRMHAMHGVVLLALLGFILSAGRLMMTLASADGVKPTSGASLGLMALFCGLLTGLCVKSFIEARKKRQSETAEPTE
ncbi:MAG: hypothetical protein VXZ54_08740 [Planctomycetota bacterium]|nr:hypothetical protein [Planctomycetota bacterium]MEC8433015.1 hypothetical protein [Planctomycetota bacterium]MEC8799506.1 hypothetical protein [Planctomycetota bacterium]MEC8862913.1 hypothetical protein [Planctomycetota bacterium]MED5286466.1 hypothetical protein [Planctomycetota bacterium]